MLPELIGKTIVLDPTGGGNDTDGTGPLGSRGTDFNLRIAERTASLLRGAGAEVLLTRDDERWVPPEEKVLLANESGADLFLTIGRCQDPAFRYSALHHHGSSTGQAWAELFAQAVAPLPAITPALGYDSDSDSPAPDAKSSEARVIQRRHFSEDKRKYSHVTAMATLNQDAAEKKAGILRVGLLMVREGECDERRTTSVLQSLQIGRPVIASFWTH